MCIKCGSARVAHVHGKCSDLCSVSIGAKEHDGYVPNDMGIGGGDYIRFAYCLECGQIQRNFPIGPTELEEQPAPGDEK